MNTKNIKQIAIGLLIGAVLHNPSFAGSVTGSHRLEPAVPGMPEKETVQRYHYAIIKTPYRSAGQPAVSHNFNAGENSFSVGGDDWFRD